MDFQYLVQAPVINNNDCKNIKNTLWEFHEHKNAILEPGAHLRAHNNPIDNW